MAGTGLDRVDATLTGADLAATPAERFLCAHLAALQVAGVVIAARARPATGGGPRNAWRLLAHLAPEFAEWAGFFAATQAKRQAVAAGATALVGTREADDLLRDARAFRDAVARRLARPSGTGVRGAG